MSKIIPKNWEEVKLGELAREIRESFEPSQEEAVFYIGLEHIEKDNLLISSIGQSNETESTKRQFITNDVLFGSLRPYFRKIYMPKFRGVCSTDITVLRANDNTDPSFLKYLVSSYEFIQMASNYSNGSRMPRVKWSDLAKLNWMLPNHSTQTKIGKLLSVYDELIENNRKRIEILEEMAQLLYREWFVEFRFPGHEEVKMISTELDKIPEGWGVEKVSNIIKRYSPGKLYDSNTVSEKGRVPVLDQGQTGIIGYHNDEPSLTASLHNPIIIFANHTCYQRVINFPFSAIQNVIPFKTNKRNARNLYWLHYATNELIELNDYKGHWPEFMTKKLSLPPNHICEKFGQIVEGFARETLFLNRLNSNLSKIKDLVLPKLMSGEVNINDLNI